MSSHIAECTALIVAGGESRRMGRDKATLPFAGQVLVDTLAERLQTLFPQVLVSVRVPRADIHWPQVHDDPALAGPLAGLQAGLTVCTTPWLFALAVDMPFLEAHTIARLAARRSTCDVVLPVCAGEAQPLAAFYAVGETQRQLRGLLAGSDTRRSLRALLERLRVLQVDVTQLEVGAQAFADLDTPEDVRKYALGVRSE